VVENEYGAGPGSEALDNFNCKGTETSLLSCILKIGAHIDDVALSCSNGMILIVSVTVANICPCECHQAVR